MRELKLSTAANVMVFMTDSADHVTGKTSLTLTITASKDGAAFSSISPTVTERGNGWYNVALTTSHTDTLGDLALHVTATGADPTDLPMRVIAMDKTVANTPANVIQIEGSDATDQITASVPTAAQNAAATEAAILDEGDATALLAAIAAKVEEFLINEGDATATLAAIAAAVRTNLATELGRIDATISSRSSHTAANVRTEMDSNSTKLASIEGDTQDIQAKIGTPATTSVSADIAAVKAQADTAVSQTAGSAIRTAVGLGAANLDTQLNSIYTAMATAVNLSALAAKFSGITSLADWLRRMCRGDAGTVGMIAAQDEINTGGTSTFDGTTDNLQDIKDASGGGGGGGGEVTGFSDAAKLEMRSTLRGVVLRVHGPVTHNEDDDLTEITLVIGDDYLAADGREISFDLDGAEFPDLTDATITLRLKPDRSASSDDEDAVVTITGTATVPTGDTKRIQFEPTAAETALLTETGEGEATGEFDVHITDADGHKITPLELRGVLNCRNPLASA